MDSVSTRMNFWSQDGLSNVPLMSRKCPADVPQHPWMGSRTSSWQFLAILERKIWNLRFSTQYCLFYNFWTTKPHPDNLHAKKLIQALRKFIHSIHKVLPSISLEPPLKHLHSSCSTQKSLKMRQFCGPTHTCVGLECSHFGLSTEPTQKLLESGDWK